MANELEVLNQFCKELYESTDQAVRLRAEQNLAEWSNSPEWLRLSTMLLDRGEVPYGPMVASNTLIKLLNNKTSILTEQRLELSQFVLSLLGQRAQSLPQYVVTSLCQLFARITKLEWTYFDPKTQGFPFRDPVDSIIKSVSLDNVNESLLAIQLLSLLVSDVTTSTGMESITKHRKSSSNFRDAYLFTIFQMTVSNLETIIDRQLSDEQVRFSVGVLELCLNCLSFDFIGSLTDETSEDNYNVQVPTLWRLAFNDGSIVKLMFSLYIKLPQDASEKIFMILVQLASIRRTLFSANERQGYLEQLVIGTKNVIENPSKLQDQGAFHEFCRLISRLKANFQLCELIKVDEYAQLLRLLAEFTVQSLRMIDFSPNSSYYLLCFWYKMVTSVPYVRTQDDHQLNVFCPEIYKAFVESRLANVERVIRDGAEDPLEDQGSLLQILEQIVVICRCEYEKTFELLCAFFDENAQIYERSPINDIHSKIAEGRLCWVVTLMGSAIFGKTSSSNNDEHDKMDGEMMCRVLRLMAVSDARLEFRTGNADPGNVKMEIALIHAIEHFRRSYIMDQVEKVTRTQSVYAKMQEVVSIGDESEMLGAIVRKIITNLKYWTNNDVVLELTLCLLKDLSLGFTAVRRLFRLPDIQLLLNNHTAEHFAFLGPTASCRSMKHRTTFYEALTRLLTSDLNEDDEIFSHFMAPLNDSVRQIIEAFSTGTAVNHAQLKNAIIGLCRDIRGIAIACTTKMLFQILFDWMFPDVFAVMLRAIETWPSDNEVTTPVFRLLSELSQNRQQRLKFEMSSCSAVLLFREISKAIVAYGNHLLQLPTVPKEDLYRKRFKNIGVIFGILKAALIGAYVPFGVFRLYGDSSLQDALDMFIRLFTYIPEEDFHSYTKIACNYYHLLEAVTTDNMAFISRLEPPVFAALLRSVQHGVMSIDAAIITSACSSLDVILNYLYRRLTRSTTIVSAGAEPDGDNCIHAVKAQPQLLSELLSAMLSAMMFGEVKCQWSMSRPLLGLILLQEGSFADVKEEFARQQPEDKVVAFKFAFEGLMDGIERNLTVKNKDVFTQNLAKFRREVVDIIKGKPSSPTTVGGGPVMMD